MSQQANPEIDVVMTQRPAGQPSQWRLYVAVLLVFLALYAATAQIGPAWQDSGIYQNRIVEFRLQSPHLGLALAHPLMIVAGRIFELLPIGPLAWRLNLMSAVFGAIAAANVALVARWLTPSVRWAAWAAAGFFGLAHTVWWLSTITESQTLHVALFTLALAMLVQLLRRPSATGAMLLGLTGGLAWTAHNLALLALPAWGLAVLVLCIRGRLRWSGLAGFVFGLFLGAGGMLIMIYFEANNTSWPEAVASALFGSAYRQNVLGGSARAVGLGLGWIAWNLPNLAVVLMLAGLVRLKRNLIAQQAGASADGLAWVLAYLAAAYFVFAVRYTVEDQFMFFLPFYAMVAILAAIGGASLTLGGRRGWLAWAVAMSLVIGPALYAAGPAIWRAAKLPVPGRKDLALRDGLRYWLTPWKTNEDSASEFARRALRDVPDGSVIIADSTTYWPLDWVRRFEMPRQDIQLLLHGSVEVLDSRDHVHYGQNNIFTVSSEPRYCPAWVHKEGCTLKPFAGVLFQVVWPNPTTDRPERPADRVPTQ